ncbi:ABC transporter substrate-binding protein [Paenibacillus polymyxa]|uniref:Fe3+-citrate ABC transporter substrate-binding protein n=1 Tax=Paenibacillus polymyxa (strain SC2) TaxID=886882 RepID=E3E4Z3_PAEPS|nr:iron-siderophore ABC transporter substrate-binding protein [Paenibacillus polymyxa]ADO57201.1 Fe3+-citrate ABC transporter substrate-binding protein [Paenibacillus polymyxa SC2]WPQ54993.1 iron-siderophore ABC transporter substrate-binding protein [Paenibacillus polymyxa]CCC85987.1 iron(III) dicitrate-binding periplasmic protein Flags: Precursor [Paenibacillus polymyxa M1]
MKKGFIGFLLLLTFMLTLAGCGATDNAANKGQTATSGSKPTEAATGPVTVKHNRGELTLDKPAQRVVVLEWTFTEDLIALGVQPVGNADNANYKVYVTPEAALDSNVVDVGTRNEPNLEAIAALKPDLIISNFDGNEAIYEQLKAIAPTIEYNLNDGNGYDYDKMVEIFNSIAVALGKEDKAKQVLADLDQHYAEAKQKLAAADKSDFHFILTQAFTSQNAASLRMFSDNSVVVGTLAKIGLVNDWKPSKVESYGFSTVGIEALSAVQDSNFIYIVQPDDNVFGSSMKNNSVWNGLKFVKEKRTYPLASTTWTFGGPVSSKGLVDGVVGAITQ